MLALNAMKIAFPEIKKVTTPNWTTIAFPQVQLDLTPKMTAEDILRAIDQVNMRI